MSHLWEKGNIYQFNIFSMIQMLENKQEMKIRKPWQQPIMVVALKYPGCQSKFMHEYMQFVMGMCYATII